MPKGSAVAVAMEEGEERVFEIPRDVSVARNLNFS
jgi:hypothetical protein